MQYPLGITSFQELRENGLPYVDKTDIMYQYLINDSYSYMSICRPDGFGKSLLLSTLEAFFQGKKELFKGLKIESLNPKWKEREVFLFDLGQGEYKTEKDLEKVLDKQLSKYEGIYGIKPKYKWPSFRIRALIRAGYKTTGHGAVVLVDDYDKPILDTLETEEEDKVRGLLKSFLMCFKSSQPEISYGIITGKTRLGKLSIFSDINNISDLGTWRELDTLCGFTRQEIMDNFSESISEFARSVALSYEEMMDRICERYEGYRFTERPTKVMNPYSILHALANKRLDDYWFKSVNPLHMAQLMTEKNYDLTNLIEYQTDEENLYRCEEILITPMLYQNGYLTIKEYDENEWHEFCKLDFPNAEVEKNFMSLLSPFYTQVSSEDITTQVTRLAETIKGGDIDAFLTLLKTAFFPAPYYTIIDRDNQPHDNNDDLYFSPYHWNRLQSIPFHNLLFLVSRFMNKEIRTQLYVDINRTSLAIWTSECIYLVEFICDSTPKKALEVIHSQGYERFFDPGEANVKFVGVNYSTSERDITGWNE